MKARNLSAAILVLFAGAALAIAEPAPSDPVLKGPQVKDGGVPGSRRPFADRQPGDNKQRRADRPMPQMEFMRAVNVLRDESTAANLRLTDDQQKKIQEINKEFEQSVRSFREEHKAEFQAMRSQGEGQFGERGRPPRRPGPQSGDAPPPPPPESKDGPEGSEMAPPPPEHPAPPTQPDAAMRQRFEELRAQAPTPKDAQAKIFAVLTDEQKPIVQERLESIKKEMSERGPRDRARSGGPLGSGGPNQGRFNPDNLPPKLQERLANMTPEERQEALAKFRERGPRGGGPGGQNRPAPEALPADLQETWNSLTPQERNFLMQQLRERAAENGESLPADRQRRRRPRPPQDQPPPATEQSQPAPAPGN